MSNSKNFVSYVIAFITETCFEFESFPLLYFAFLTMFRVVPLLLFRGCGHSWRESAKKWLYVVKYIITLDVVSFKKIYLRFFIQFLLVYLTDLIYCRYFFWRPLNLWNLLFCNETIIIIIVITTGRIALSLKLRVYTRL